MKKENLTTEYIPLDKNSVKLGEVYGPIKYFVSQQTRDKTVQLIEESDLEGKTKIEFPYLMPSDMWSWARVMSNYFGRLNEVMLAKSTWHILGKAVPDEELSGISTVKRVMELKGLPFAQIETITRNHNDEPILISNDMVLMLHGLEKQVYDGRIVRSEIPREFLGSTKRKIYFRHKWNETKWKNNIHTTNYAQKFGFKEELPEFITYMDSVSMLLFNLNGENIFDGTSIDLKRIFPLYKGEIISLYAEKEVREDSLVIRAFLDGTNEERFMTVCKNIRDTSILQNQT